MTISMLALAGIPATAGLHRQVLSDRRAVAGGYTWLGVVIVIGSMISLGYYLPVIAAIWMRESPAGADAGAPARPRVPAPGSLPALAGGSPELDEQPALQGTAQPEVLLVALLAAAATIFFGIVPQPLFDLVHHAGTSLAGLF